MEANPPRDCMECTNSWECITDFKEASRWLSEHHAAPALGQNEKRNRRLAEESNHSSILWGTKVWELKEQGLLLSRLHFFIDAIVHSCCQHKHMTRVQSGHIIVHPPLLTHC